MTYDQEILEDILRSGCIQLLEEQPMLFDPNADINERTVAGELSAIISPRFEGLHTNCEYNRMTDENGIQIPKRIGLNPNSINPSRVFPDIIVHRQEDGDHNLLIIEIKMSWKNSRKDDDLAKLQKYLEELRYQFGLYLELGANGIEEMKWYQ